MIELEEQVATKILDILSTDVPELNYLSFEDVKVAIDDFREFELPAVQLWDVSQDITHERGYEKTSWTIVLEIIMKSTTSNVVKQKDLWALRHKIGLALWDEPNLGIPGVIHLRYKNNLTDLHLLQPFYTARMEFEVLFRRQLTRSC